MGLVRAVSIGFRAIEYAFMDGRRSLRRDRGLRAFAVTIPANADALITRSSRRRQDGPMHAMLAREVRAIEHGVPDPEIPVATGSAATGKKSGW
jgi:hypothetical protein